MKNYILVFWFVWCNLAYGSFEIVSNVTETLNKDSDRYELDCYLTTKIKNTSDRRLYIMGESTMGDKGWFLIESYIKEPDSKVWKRQNSGGYNSLRLLPVEAGETITTVRRIFRKEIGHQMLLTFEMDYTASSSPQRVLLGDFIIPELTEEVKDFSH